MFPLLIGATAVFVLLGIVIYFVPSSDETYKYNMSSTDRDMVESMKRDIFNKSFGTYDTIKGKNKDD